MNKQEAIEQINYMDTLNINDKTACQQVDMVIKNQVLDIIDQIDEPQKPVVPQFVADWYEENKDNFEMNLYNLCVDFHKQKLPDDLYEWFNKLSDKPIETFVKMKLFGYEVEKKKLYTVEIPNPNSAGGKTVLSKQQSTGKLILEMLNSDINKPKYLHLTEAEIKKDFDWAFRWAKEVE